MKFFDRSITVESKKGLGIEFTPVYTTKCPTRMKHVENVGHTNNQSGNDFKVKVNVHWFMLSLHSFGKENLHMM